MTMCIIYFRKSYTFNSSKLHVFVFVFTNTNTQMCIIYFWKSYTFNSSKLHVIIGFKTSDVYCTPTSINRQVIIHSLCKQSQSTLILYTTELSADPFVQVLHNWVNTFCTTNKHVCTTNTGAFHGQRLFYHTAQASCCWHALYTSNPQCFAASLHNKKEENTMLIWGIAIEASTRFHKRHTKSRTDLNYIALKNEWISTSQVVEKWVQFNQVQ
jgi:hypothetical protein